MKKPLEIRFLGMDASEALETAALEKAAKLEQFCADLTSCRITIDAEHRHKHQGHPYAVRIDLTFPGHELNVDRVQNEDAYVALRDAFDAMKRKLEETVRRSQEKHQGH
jgi:ribosomal subunit interface protein